MPQISAFPDSVPEMFTFAIVVVPPAPERGGWDVQVKVANTPTDVPMTVWAGTLKGVGADMLPTLVREALAAWQFGECRRDIQIACADVAKASRLHASLHEL